MPMFISITLGFVAIAALSLLAGFMLTCHVWEHRRFVRGGFGIDLSSRFIGKVGVIVPCKDVDLKLKENLRCLFDQTFDNYEIYFVVQRKSNGPPQPPNDTYLALESTKQPPKLRSSTSPGG